VEHGRGCKVQKVCTRFGVIRVQRIVHIAHVMRFGRVGRPLSSVRVGHHSGNCTCIAKARPKRLVAIVFEWISGSIVQWLPICNILGAKVNLV